MIHPSIRALCASSALGPGLLLIILLLFLGACGEHPESGGATVILPSESALSQSSLEAKSIQTSPLLNPTSDQASPQNPQETDQQTILIDGSSTVFPIAEAATLAFRKEQPDISVHLGVSGTGGGFKKFCRGETDISDASRPIKVEEARRCAESGIEFIEVPIAFDGLSVVVHPSNDWVDCLSVETLRSIWEPEAESQVLFWNQARDDWPERPLQLFAPGRDSGTFDYFTSAIVGKEGMCRDDFIGSEDDYLLAQDIAETPNGLGFFGYAYYSEYREKLKLVEIDSGQGCIKPSAQSIETGDYRPLARPVFLYLSTQALERPAVSQFVDFFLAGANHWVRQVRYVPLPNWAYSAASQRVSARRVGSVFSGGSQIGVSVRDLFPTEHRP